MADFGITPENTTTVSTVLSILRGQRDTLAQWTDATSDTNIGIGHKRWSTTNARSEYWDGTQWQILDPATYNHVRITAGNPHGTTPAMIGAATKVEFDAFVALRNNPHEVAVAQVVGAASTASLTAHTSRTDNPHSTTAAQVGALAAANNLSDLTNVATALNNLGAASASVLTNHMGLTNPHGLTRGDLGAATAGLNLDISELLNVGTVRRTLNHLRLEATGGASRIYFGVDATDKLAIDASHNFFPTTNGGANLGTSSFAWNTIYFTNMIRNANAVKQPWTFFTYTAVDSLNPVGVSSTQCAHAINSIAKKLENLGLFN